MKTIHQQQENTDKKKTKGYFWKILGGDILVSKAVVQWYPYLLLLFILGAILVYNDKLISKKNKTIADKDREYKTLNLKIKNSSAYMYFDTDSTLMQMIKEQGFIQNNKTIYKISVRE
ncbi:MAG: hypothetical protein LBU51_03865 [Bacteroidales bacterium]|jgi:hypothetical protein|nr:hypothetical protein [Bacteroidales bacterium]